MKGGYNMKGYCGTEYNSLEEFKLLLEDMDIDVDVMYKAIDKDLPKLFLYNYNDWNKCRKIIMNNSYNDCNHVLSKEIKEYYNLIIEKYKDELYFTF